MTSDGKRKCGQNIDSDVSPSMVGPVFSASNKPRGNRQERRRPEVGAAVLASMDRDQPLALNGAIDDNSQEWTNQQTKDEESEDQQLCQRSLLR